MGTFPEDWSAFIQLVQCVRSSTPVSRPTYGDLVNNRLNTSLCPPVTPSSDHQAINQQVIVFICHALFVLTITHFSPSDYLK